MLGEYLESYLEGVKRLLAPEVFDDFVRKHERIAGGLKTAGEVAEKFADLDPPGMINLVPGGWVAECWAVNWIRERGGLDYETMHRLNYEEFVEWGYRVLHAIDVCKKAVAEKPPPEELIKSEWLCHLSHPPAYMVRPDLGFSTTQALYGKYATTMWAHANWWTGEFTWFQGFHNEDGIPVQHWVIAVAEELLKHFDEEDRRTFLTPSDFMAAPKHPSALLDRRHLRLGIKMREMPKKVPFVMNEWLRATREIVMDLREELFPKWAHATLYLSFSPGIYGISTQQHFWSTTGFWGDPWYALNAARLLGHPIEYYTYEPLPPIVNTLVALPKEVFCRRLTEMFLMGPKGLLCDAINKKITSKEKTPLLHGMRELFEKGRAFKGWAVPYDDGIPPPRAWILSAPAPLHEETYVTVLVANPENIPKETRDFFESEAGVDWETGRVPPYSEWPRLNYVFDPTFEWLKPKDFPPIDWQKGQVWPVDVTREKMQLMVEEGYDGSGKDILHYSALADKKMGELGKTILLGTIPYKKPVCGCSPKCG